MAPKRTEHALCERPGPNCIDFRHFIEHAPLAVVMTDGEGVILRLSPRARQILHAGEGELRRYRLLELIDPRGEALERLGLVGLGLHAAAERWPGMVELDGQRADGEPVPLLVGLVPLTFDGAPHVLAFFEDVGLRRQREEAAEAAEARYQALLSSLPACIVMFDLEGRILYVNDEVVRQLGFEPESFLGRPLSKLLEGEAREGFLRSLQVVREHGAYEGHTLVPTASGEERIWFTRSVRVEDHSGPPYVISSSVDVTEAQRAVRELERVHRANEAILRAIPSFLILVANDGRVLEWNTTAERVFGIARDDALGRPILELALGLDADAVANVLERCRRERSVVRPPELRFTRRDGSPGFLGLAATPLESFPGEVPHVLLIGSDITDRRVMESQLMQSQKLESIGQLAAGIAHEINTPTQYVGDNVQFLRESFEALSKLLDRFDDLMAAARSGAVPRELVEELSSLAEEADLEYLREEIPRAIEQSLEGVERVSRIVRAMKEFSHPGSAEKAAVDLNRCIESTVTVARNEWKYVAEVELELDPELPPVPCLEGEMNQVFLNLLVNAAHAIAEAVADKEEKGTIRISTRRDGEWVEIRVADTGCGIPEAIRERIFDPFFTTKEVGRGTGQGLAIARSVVVDKHGGSIEVESEVGRGSTFRIRLPLAPEPGSGDSAASTAAGTRGAR